MSITDCEVLAGIKAREEDKAKKEAEKQARKIEREQKKMERDAARCSYKAMTKNTPQKKKASKRDS